MMDFAKRSSPCYELNLRSPTARRTAVSSEQSFIKPGDAAWLKIDFLPGVELMSLAQPVPEGSIHRARLTQGTVIPVHTHPDDEYVLVLSGTAQGPHIAHTEAELLTVRLGATGPFGDQA